MRDRRGIPTLAWVGLGLLILAALLLSLGRRDLESKPNADSFGPSGASAFRELLERNGYDVRIDRSSRPLFYPDDTVIAFFRQQPLSIFGTEEESAGYGDKYEDPTQDSLHSFLDRGGRAIFLPIKTDFPGTSAAALKAPVAKVRSPYAKGAFGITADASATTPFLDKFKQSHFTASSLWKTEVGDEEVSGIKVGDGRVLVLRSGLGVTNRFLDRNDNAAFLLQLVRSLAKDSRRVVFVEATFDEPQERSLVEAIGPWANAAWQQLLVLAVVVIYTLGKRLGIPEAYRARQRGSREMVDAVADTMQRSRSADFAMRVALERSDVQLRNALKLSRDADRTARDSQLPDTLLSAIAALEAASVERKAPEADALRRIQRLERELGEFLGSRQKPGRRVKLRS